jgi:hypothetical protein
MIFQETCLQQELDKAEHVTSEKKTKKNRKNRENKKRKRNRNIAAAGASEVSRLC